MNVQTMKRLLRLHHLILKGGTGKAEDLAIRMEVSARTVFSLIAQLREMGAVVLYDIGRESYFYGKPFTLTAEYEVKFGNWPDIQHVNYI